MRILDVQQRSPQWQEARRGIPTASQFDRLITPKTLKASTQATDYLCELVAERLGIFPESASSGWMERGTDLEDEAASWYAFDRGVPVRTVGFCLHDTLAVGCSPDRLVGSDGGLEIKNVKVSNHIRHLLDAGDENEYRLQIQGTLWITGRDWWDRLYYHPELPRRVVRIFPEPEVFALLDSLIPTFIDAVDAAEAKIRTLGGRTIRGVRREPVPEYDDSVTSDLMRKGIL